MRAPAWLAAVTLAAAVPAWTDTEFRAGQMTRTDRPSGKGECEIRLQIDGEVVVSVYGDMVHIHAITGHDGRDDGSACNAPLPNRAVRNFGFEVREGRGEIRLLDEPSRRNGYRASVRIRDGITGEGRYDFRLTWAMSGKEDFTESRPNDDSDGRGGLAWNNVTHFAESGHGSSTRSGDRPQRLSNVTVDIDRGGKVLVSFRTDHGGPLSFSGALIASDENTWKADMATDDHDRLRGSMILSRTPHGEISRITLEATDGQDHLSLDWNRR